MARLLLPAARAAALLGFLLGAAGPLQAVCPGPWDGTFRTSTTSIASPGINTPESIESAFWALGFENPTVGAGDDNGAWQDADASPDTYDWLYPYPGTGRNFLYGTWSSSAQIDGCILGRVAPGKTREIMVVALSDQDPPGQNGFFALAAVGRGQSDPQFDFAFPIDLRSIPTPVVLASSRISPTEVSVSLRGPSLAQIVGGVYGDGSTSSAETILGYKVYTR